MAKLSRLRFLRLLAGLRQYEVAERAGIHESLVSMYENGRRRIPEEHLRRIAAVLNVAPEELVGVVGDETEPKE